LTANRAETCAETVPLRSEFHQKPAESCIRRENGCAHDRVPGGDHARTTRQPATHAARTAQAATATTTHEGDVTMDANTYGRLVEHGGYATGGIVRHSGLVLVGEAGPELSFTTAGDVITAGEMRLQLLASRTRRYYRDPDDGAAGVLAPTG
jgi:hypothetical protein